MKKTGLVLMVMVFLFTFTVFAAPAEKPGVYMIQKGDTLWWLEGYHRGDPSQWRRIVDENPFLKEPGRIYEKGGKTIALIKPGEQLKGLVELGILPREAPISEFQVQIPEPSRGMGNIWYLLLGLGIAAAVYGLYRLIRIFSDPATSGQPVVRGGLSANQPRDIENRFQQIASARIESGEPIPQRVGPIEEGFLSGYGRVQYRDRSEMKRLNREPAFRARFRFHDGREEDLFFLQRCANDVVLYHTRYIGFTFEPGRQVVPVAEPQVRPGVHPPLRVADSGEPAVTVARLEINGLEIVAPEGSTFTVSGDKIIIAISHAGDITIGRVEKIKKAKVVKSPAAAVAS